MKPEQVSCGNAKKNLSPEALFLYKMQDVPHNSVTLKSPFIHKDTEFIQQRCGLYFTL